MGPVPLKKGTNLSGKAVTRLGRQDGANILKGELGCRGSWSRFYFVFSISAEQAGQVVGNVINRSSNVPQFFDGGMKYGVHLMCVEDGLDSSTSMGKMMIIFPE